MKWALAAFGAITISITLVRFTAVFPGFAENPHVNEMLAMVRQRLDAFLHPGRLEALAKEHASRIANGEWVEGKLANLGREEALKTIFQLSRGTGVSYSLWPKKHFGEIPHSLASVELGGELSAGTGEPAGWHRNFALSLDEQDGPQWSDKRALDLVDKVVNTATGKIAVAYMEAEYLRLAVDGKIVDVQVRADPSWRRPTGKTARVVMLRHGSEAYIALHA